VAGLEVLVAGGGLGGLTAALCLARRGHRVTVAEQADAFAEAGAGIQLSPNATRVLHHLGLAAPLRGCAFVPEATQFRHWRSGRVIAETPLGESLRHRYGAPYYHVHRGDLLGVLLEAAREQPAIELLTGARLSECEDDGAAVTVSLAGEARRVDLLVGADGIHSVVREALWGPAQPRFTGNLAWRALVPAERLAAGLVPPTATVWWGPGRHFVHYYVRRGELVNCVCVVEKSQWTRESWTEPGAKAELRADFAGWHSTVQTLIDAADPQSLFKWALFDRSPMARWGRGRITLLGDSCHATLPFMAQGAAMALEDAAVLAACLDRYDAVPAALARYERLRRPRTAAVQQGSRRNARVFHLSGPAAWARNRLARRAGRRAMDGLFRYDALNAVAAETQR